ncbi:hypothetical protein EGY59_24095, partial [Salmonella enterica]|nr:hypothetical protein [Salmonella enterica]
FVLFISGVQATNISLQLNLTTATDRLLSGSFTSADAILDSDMKGFQLNNPTNIVNVYPVASNGVDKYAGFSLSGNTSVIKLIGQKYGATIEIPFELVAFDASSSAEGNDGTAVIAGTCKGSDLSHLVSPGVFKSVAQPLDQNFCTTSSHLFLFQDTVTPFQIKRANYQWKIKDGKDFNSIFNERNYPSDIYSGSTLIQSTEIHITNSATGDKDSFINGFLMNITWDNKPYINHVTSSNPDMNFIAERTEGNRYKANGSLFISVGGALGRSLRVTPRSTTTPIGNLRVPEAPLVNPLPYKMEIISLNSGARFKLIDGVLGKSWAAEFNTTSIEDGLNMNFRIDVSAEYDNPSPGYYYIEYLTFIFETNELF